MPANPAWVPLLVDELPEGAHFQTIAIGREEVWAVHDACARLGGDVRTGLEDTFYLPDGSRAKDNGELISALVCLLLCPLLRCSLLRCSLLRCCCSSCSGEM